MDRQGTARAIGIAGVLLLAVSGAQLFPARGAANPSEGKLDPAHTTVTWSGGPLNGANPALRRYLCTPSNCEDFALDVNLPASAFPGRLPVMKMELEASGDTVLEFIVYEPGKSPTPDETAYTPYPSGAKIRSPRAGRWTLRVGCPSLCANTTYTATVSLETVPIPANNAPHFVSQVLPGLPGGEPEGAAEPGIEIGPNDEVWVNGVGSAADFWGSYDGGKSFVLRQPDLINGSGDTWLTVGPDGTLYADNLVVLGGGANAVFVSTDKGQTWNPTPCTQALTAAGSPAESDLGACPNVANTNSDRQWLTAHPTLAGTVFMEYHELGTGNNIWVWRSTDYGTTWLPMAHISPQELLGNGSIDTPLGNVTGPIVFDPSDPEGKTMHFAVAFSPFVESATALPTEPDFHLVKLFVLTSTDGGSTWSFEVAHDTGSQGRVSHLFPWLTTDKAGNLYLVWAERKATDKKTSVQMVVSRDKGATWSAPIKVSRNNGSNVFPAIGAEGDPGRVSVAWVESDATDYDDDKATWKVVMAQTANAFDAKPAFDYLQVSPDVMHEGDICQSGLNCTVTGGNRTLLDFIHMDIDSKGMAHVVYTDDLSGVRTVYAKQIGGMSTLGSPGPVQPKPKPRPTPRVLPRKQRLPATGVGAGGLGVVLLAIAFTLTLRARRTRFSAV